MSSRVVHEGRDEAPETGLAPSERRIRTIKSYVLRQGRVSNAQQKAYEALMPRWGLPYRPEYADLPATFGRAAPHVLEIGFGMGETTATIAAARPEVDFVAVEVHTPGVGALLKLLDQTGLANVRIVQHDAVDVLRDMIRPDSLDGIHIFFPDPWPKSRHHKRRLVQPEFARLAASRLRPGGYIHAATDWEEYAHWILGVLSAEPALENTAAEFAPRPAYRPLTKFEQRGLRLGHGVWDLVFRRRDPLAGLPEGVPT